MPEEQKDTVNGLYFLNEGDWEKLLRNSFRKPAMTAEERLAFNLQEDRRVFNFGEDSRVTEFVKQLPPFTVVEISDGAIGVGGDLSRHPPSRDSLAFAFKTSLLNRTTMPVDEAILSVGVLMHEGRHGRHKTPGLTTVFEDGELTDAGRALQLHEKGHTQLSLPGGHTEGKRKRLTSGPGRKK